MFGYIRPNKLELKLKDINRYSNYYCALCDQLSRNYGFRSRFVLNYDVTFLLICLDYLAEGDKESRKIRCPYNFFRAKMVKAIPETLRYSAFINYWLVIQKLSDDYRDDKFPWKSWIYNLLISKKKYQLISKVYEPLVNELTELLNQIYQKESHLKDAADFDSVTNLFGEFFSKLFQAPFLSCSQEADFNLISCLAFQLGKWIYIIDAFDDFERDTKKKQFNLLFSLNDGAVPSKETVFEMALTLHLQIKYKIHGLLSRGTVSLRDDCIVNIVTYGIDEVFYKIVKKKYCEFEERVKNIGNFSLEQLDGEDK